MKKKTQSTCRLRSEVRTKGGPPQLPQPKHVLVRWGLEQRDPDAPPAHSAQPGEVLGREEGAEHPAQDHQDTDVQG